MSFLERLKNDARAFKAQRETAAGRRFELRMITADCNVLIIGCVGLAISFAPLIYASALGHLVVGVLTRRNTSNLIQFWAVGVVVSLVMIAVTSSLVFAGTYGVQHYYFGIAHDAVTAELSANWLYYVAIAIVVGGMISVLFAHPGAAAQLAEYSDRAETDAQESRV